MIGVSRLSVKRIRLLLVSFPYCFVVDMDLSLSKANIKDIINTASYDELLFIDLLNHHRWRNNYTNLLTDNVLSSLSIKGKTPKEDENCPI
ncbi:hypothetical protein H8356DRAFT_1433738 [Neocallimastix lanati (nom. inval.)]|nr:hypothetical protein H8356DRAFT_1433738 [Neocallimastix sp. JGI-2020a]